MRQVRRRLAAGLLAAGLVLGAGIGPAAAAAPARAAATAPRHSRTDWGVDIAKGLGLAAVGIALVFFSEGFGLLGGRIRAVGSPVPNEDER